MLVRWLPETPDTIPVNASHRLGVVAFVLNDKREVLVVQELSGGFQGTGVRKLPTGVVNEGEDISHAVVRAVKEGTGVDAKFVEVLCFGQSHEFFTKSDLFFLCVLRPESSAIDKQNVEIEAEWMPMEEYAAQPFVFENEQFYYMAKICSARAGYRYPGFGPLVYPGFGPLVYPSFGPLVYPGFGPLVYPGFYPGFGPLVYPGFGPLATTTGSGKRSYIYCNNPEYVENYASFI